MNFPNCIPQTIYKPDEIQEYGMSDCCGAEAISEIGETEPCGLCGQECLIISSESKYE